MADREKVIKGLECCTRYEVAKQLNNCLDCPYVEPIGFNQFRCKSQEMKEDALELLKEQKKTTGKWIYCEVGNGQDGYRCSRCCFFEPWYYGYEDIEFIKRYKYCPKCGRQMNERDHFPRAGAGR